MTGRYGRPAGQALGRWRKKNHGGKMYCPLCKAEYREGFYTCADCLFSLVVGRPPRDEVKEPLPSEGPKYYTGGFVEVFRTDDFSEILLIKTVFENEEIPSNCNDFMLMSEPALARIIVPTEFVELARTILIDMKSFLLRGAQFPI